MKQLIISYSKTEPSHWVALENGNEVESYLDIVTLENLVKNKDISLNEMNLDKIPHGNEYQQIIYCEAGDMHIWCK